MKLSCCCCWAKQENVGEQQLIYNEIEAALCLHQQNLQKARKILLLGTGESGKSTFMKQMRIIHGNGYSDEDKREFIKVVYQNIYTAMHALIKAMDNLQIPYEVPEHHDVAELLLATPADKVKTLTDPYLSAIDALWSDNGIQSCYERQREYQLIDSAKYFLNNLQRIAQLDYLPTVEDILRSRVVTTGIVEHIFDTERITLRIIDVGGQRSERRKWLQCFDDVTAIIFLVALSEYDQQLYESPELNRMEESKSLFSVIVSAPYFKDASIILFLNKKDILEEKIMSSHLVDYFPDFGGPRRNAVAAQKFIGDMFVSLQQEDKPIYPHYTCATDTRNIRLVFLAVQDTIMRNYLGDIGIH